MGRNLIHASDFFESTGDYHSPVEVVYESAFNDGYIAAVDELFDTFMEASGGGYKAKFELFNVNLRTYGKKYPELKKAGIDIAKINKEIAKLGGQMKPDTGRKILHLYNTICDYVSKAVTYFLLGLGAINTVSAGAGGAIVGTAATGSVAVGLSAGLGAAAGVGVVYLLLTGVACCIDSIYRWAFEFGEFAVAEGDMQGMMNNLNALKAQAKKAKNKKLVQKVDKLIDKLEKDIENLRVKSDNQFDESAGYYRF